MTYIVTFDGITISNCQIAIAANENPQLFNGSLTINNCGFFGHIGDSHFGRFGAGGMLRATVAATVKATAIVADIAIFSELGTLKTFVFAGLLCFPCIFIQLLPTFPHFRRIFSKLGKSESW